MVCVHAISKELITLSPEGTVVINCKIPVLMGSVTCDEYGVIRSSSFSSGMNVGTGPITGLAPTGFYDTVFTGTFDSAGSMLIDGATNYFFKSHGASLVGGASKVIQEDLTP